MNSHEQDLIKVWQRDGVSRERLQPAPGDPHYLPLSDLRLLLDRWATNDAIRVLDYGAGPSPYRSLFPRADYKRADYVRAPDLDYTVDQHGTLPASVGPFDIVLSTQVAEHLYDPRTYLAEAWRVLRPGGKLLLTTHGVWQEHGVPHDYQRWTAAGLERDLTHAGFVGINTYKVTGAHRALLHLGLDAILQVSPRGWLRIPFGCLRRLVHWSLPWLHRKIDSRSPQLRISSARESEHVTFYLIVAAEATKPQPLPPSS